MHLAADKDSKSFLVQTVSPGLTVLMVHGDPTSPCLSDYIPLLVLPVISKPSGSLRPGDVICFSSPITNLNGKLLLGDQRAEQNKALSCNCSNILIVFFSF